MSETSHSGLEGNQRVVRVFISSTFRDMQEERDHLIKFTFPELRRRCRNRQVDFVAVDLRWGITSEESEQGKVLPICLQEIEHSRPYFIGILGARYGWVPDHLPSDLIEKQPWLSEHLEKSVTELEILHGVLRNPKMADCSYFYFRDPAYVDTIPEERRSDYLCENTASAEKLRILKKQVLASKLPVNEYAHPKALGKLVLEDLWSAIDKQFPEDAVPDASEQEDQEHDQFATLKTKVHIDRPEYLQALNEHVQGDGSPLVILGESGIGKSALLARWAQLHSLEHQEDVVITHFIGSGPQSADHVALLRRLFSRIIEHFGMDETLPETADKLIIELPCLMASIPDSAKLVLVLDGLDQLEDKDNAPDLGWLPKHFPPNVRLIMSTTPGRSLEALRLRNWLELEVKGFVDIEERKNLAREYLDQYGKRLAPEQLELVANAPLSSNPLFLRSVLEELRVFGLYEQLNETIAHYLDTRTIPDLFRRILERWQQDYGHDLTRNAMSFIWASRRGLQETELLDLLGAYDKPLSAVAWSPFYLAISDMAQGVVIRSGLIGFSHDFIRDAVESMFLPAESDRKERHLQLAEYFSSQIEGPQYLESIQELLEGDYDKYYKSILSAQASAERSVDELPWQLARSEDWGALKNWITHPGLFYYLSRENRQFELLEYWRNLEQCGHDIFQAYKEAVGEYGDHFTGPEPFRDFLGRIAQILSLSADFTAAEYFLRKALEIDESTTGPGRPEPGTIQHNLAQILFRKGDYLESERLYRQALKMREGRLGADHLSTASCRAGVADILELRGQYDEAESLYREVIQTREKGLGANHTETIVSWSSLAGILQRRGSYRQAEDIYRWVIENLERTFGPRHPRIAKGLGNLGALLQTLGNFSEAGKLYDRALEILRQMLGEDHPDTAGVLYSYSQLLRIKGDFDESERLCGEALRINEDVLGAEHEKTLTCSNDLASLMAEKGNLSAAQAKYSQVLDRTRTAFGDHHPRTATAMNNVADFHYQKGEYIRAESMLLQAYEIVKQTFGPDHPDLGTSHVNIARVFGETGQYQRAQEHLGLALEIRKKSLGIDHPMTATTMNALADFLVLRGEFGESERLLLDSLNILQKVYGKTHPDVATVKTSMFELNEAKGNYEEAQEWVREAHSMYTRIYGDNHPFTLGAASNLARILRTRGHYSEALELMSTTLKQSEAVLGPEHPRLVDRLETYASILEAHGDFDEAERSFTRALTITESTYGKTHANTAASENNLGKLFLKRSKYDEAEDHFRSAVAILKDELGAENPIVATAMQNLAGALLWKGDFDQAEQAAKQAINIWDITTGLEHPEAACSLNTLGLILEAKNDLEGAEENYLKARHIIELSKGTDHPEAMVLVNNLALVASKRGQWNRAEELYQKALNVRENRLGPKHPETAYSFNGLAEIMVQKGDWDGAETYLRRAMEIFVEAWGFNHPDSAVCVRNLGSVLTDKGDCSGAEQVYQEALSAWEVRNDHVRSQLPSILNNTGYLALSRGDTLKAEKYFRQALEVREEHLGLEHSDTLKSMRDLASVLRDMERWEEAEDLFRRIYDTRVKTLTRDHPLTADSLSDLGFLYQMRGNQEAARRNAEEVLETRRKTLGEDHPETKKTELILQGMRLIEKQKAEDLIGSSRRQLELNRQQYGSEHPETAKSCIRLGEKLREKGHIDEAETLLMEALGYFEKQPPGKRLPEMALAVCNIGLIHETRRDLDRARVLLRRACDLSESLVGTSAADKMLMRSKLAKFHHNQENYPEAESLFQQNLTRSRQLLEKSLDEIARAKVRDAAIEARHYLGLIRIEQYDLDEVETLLREAFEMLEEAYGMERPVTMICLRQLGDVLERKQEYNEAEQVYRRLLDIRIRIHGEEHADTASILCDLGDVLWRAGKMEEGERLLRKALNIREKVCSPDSDEVGNSLNSLGLLLLHVGDFQQAEPMVRKSVSIAKTNHGTRHYRFIQRLANLAYLKDKMGVFSEAKRLYLEVLELQQATLGPKTKEVSDTLNDFGELHRLHGELDEANEYLEKAHEIRRDILGDDHAQTANSNNNFGLLLASKGELRLAESHLRDAVKTWESIAPESTDTARCLSNLGHILTLQEKHEEAERLLRSSLEMREGSDDAGFWDMSTVTCLYDLSEISLAKRHYDDACNFLERAISVAKQILGSDDPNMGLLKNDLAYALREQGKYDRAEPLFEQAAEIFWTSKMEAYAANSELNVCLTRRLAGKHVDIGCVEKLTSILEKHSPEHAEKGHELLSKLQG